MTLCNKNQASTMEIERLETYSTKGKLLLNKAFNIFNKVPYEYNLKTIPLVYSVRFVIVLTCVIPLYLLMVYFAFYIYLLDKSDLLSMLFGFLTVGIALSLALLYLYDTKIGKNIEIYFKKFEYFLKPDRIKELKNKFHNKVNSTER